MTQDYERLSRSQLVEELYALEDRLADDPSEGQLKNLIQNLRVHQIELEMQNRELRDIQQALGEARDRYANLFEFAPVGCVTLNPQGVIRDINLAGAELLGRPRAELLNKPFSTCLEADHSKLFFSHLHQAFTSDEKAGVELSLRSERGGTRRVAMESVRTNKGRSATCLTALFDITQRRQAERAQRESEVRLMEIADNVPVLISYVNSDRRHVFINAAYERWFGHSRDYIHAHHMRDVLGDEAYTAVEHHVDAVFAGSTVRFEAELPNRDAGTRYVEVNYIPHRDPSGAVVGFFSLINDLSERRRVERALAEEQSFVSAVLDTAGALVVVVDRHGMIVRFNRQCELVTGYRAAEVEGKHFGMFLLPEERSGVENVFARLSSGDFPNTHDNYWVAKDGTQHLIAWSNTALTADDGRVTHIVGTGVDVTQQRRMEEDLRQHERQLRLVTDAVPVLIAYVDRDMRYQFANAAYREFFGLDPDGMTGRKVEELMAADTFNILLPFARRALDGEEVVYENVVHHRRLGQREVSATLVPDHDDTGGVKGYFSVVADITERKRSEESEKRRLLEAAHADRLSTMGEMTTEIAHELNQPLTAIATTADVCIDQVRHLAGEENDALAEALAEISSQAHRAAAIVKHVRTFARRRKPEFTRVDLKRIVDSALALIRVEARTGDVAMDAAVSGSVAVEADAVLIEQILVNLARNSIEAMTAAGTVSPRLSVAAAGTNGTVEVKVADNGPGLSVEAREHLFEPFYTTKTDGMGLGLAICRTIVEAHGGRMWADSSPEGGAEFGFTLNKAGTDKKQGQSTQ